MISGISQHRSRRPMRAMVVRRDGIFLPASAPFNFLPSPNADLEQICRGSYTAYGQCLLLICSAVPRWAGA